MRRVKRLAIAVGIAVGLAVAVDIFVPTCTSLECIACSYVLDLSLCILSTGG